MYTVLFDEETYGAFMVMMGFLQADDELSENSGIEQEILDRVFETVGRGPLVIPMPES